MASSDRRSRVRQRFSDTPTLLIQSSGNRVALDAGSARPVCEAQSLSVVGQVSGMAGVQRLLPWRGPSAVARFIVAIVVDAINRVLGRRLRSHVLVEVEKGVAPAIADGDATSAPFAKTRVLGIGASLNQTRPGAMLSSVIQSVGFVITTSARLMAAIAKPCSSRIHFVSALAVAAPVRIFTAKPTKSYDSQFSVYVACLVFNVLGQWNRIARSHLTFLDNDWVVRAESVNHDRLGSFHCATHGSVVQ